MFGIAVGWHIHAWEFISIGDFHENQRITILKYHMMAELMMAEISNCMTRCERHTL